MHVQHDVPVRVTHNGLHLHLPRDTSVSLQFDRSDIRVFRKVHSAVQLYSASVYPIGFLSP